MKILVAVKRVIDHNVQIRVKDDGSGVETENVKMSMNPPDENAVEQALLIKEKGQAEEIIIVSIGEQKTQETIRTALAMGADRGIYIKTDNNIEPLTVAKILQKIILKEKPNLVLMGKQAIDYDCNQTPQMLSALLKWPQGTFASKVDIKNNEITVLREIDEGLETLKLQLPAVISCDLRLNEPRYATLPNIMKAKKKTIDIIDVENFDIDIQPKIKIINISEPPLRKKGIMVKNVTELIDKLKNEAKII